MRPSWISYYKSTDALVMVVDSTDRARIDSVKVSPSVLSAMSLEPLTPSSLVPSPLLSRRTSCGAFSAAMTSRVRSFSSLRTSRTCGGP